MMRFAWILPLFVACPTPDTSSALTASDISYNNQNVAIALSNLEAQLLVEANRKKTGNNDI